MDNVTQLNPDNGFLEESSNLFDLCRQGDTRAFILYKSSPLQHYHFAAVNVAPNQYGLYSQAHVEAQPSYLFHLEAVVQGDFENVVKAAQETLGEDWFLLAG